MCQFQLHLLLVFHRSQSDLVLWLHRKGETVALCCSCWCVLQFVEVSWRNVWEWDIICGCDNVWHFLLRNVFKTELDVSSELRTNLPQPLKVLYFKWPFALYRHTKTECPALHACALSLLMLYVGQLPVFIHYVPIDELRWIPTTSAPILHTHYSHVLRYHRVWLILQVHTSCHQLGRQTTSAIWHQHDGSPSDKLTDTCKTKPRHSSALAIADWHQFFSVLILCQPS